MSLFLKKLLVQISMVSSRRMLVKSESISKFPMKLLESCSTISAAKLNESLTVYLLLVNDSKIGTKYFASLYVGVSKVDKYGMKGGQPSTHLLYILQEPYIILGLVPTGFRCQRVSSDMLLESTSFSNFISAFFLTGNKIQEIVVFYSSFDHLKSSPSFR